jgi:hypothetical protein
MTNEELDALRELRGLVATVVLTGSVDEYYAQALSNVRSWCDRNGFHNIEWAAFQAQLVEAGRDSVIEHALAPAPNEPPYDWIIQIDADAAPIQEDIVLQLLHDAYVLVPEANVVGAYCQLKSPPYLPTIDTGTGTWEPIFPGNGLIPVIRTGGHCLLIKTPILGVFGPPWFRTRRTVRPVDAFAEVDNYARIKLSGKNPFADLEEWGKLVTSVKEESGGGVHNVGEDSGFCDAVVAAGGRIVVDTNIVVGHVGKKIYSPIDLRESMNERKATNLLACGVY